MTDVVEKVPTRVVNGKPGWRDVLHQAELSETRTAERLVLMEKNLEKSISGVNTKVSENKQAIDYLKDDVADLKRAEHIRATRTRDLFQLFGGARGIVVAFAASAGLVLTLLNIANRL